MIKMFLLGTFIAVAASPAIAESPDASATCEVQSRFADQVHVTTVKVDGMVCDFCARAVTKVFTKNDLVDSVDVDLDEGAIIFETRGCILLDEEAIKEMVHYSGYDFVSIERSSG